MLRIELRKMFRSNGLIDDVLVYGVPEDYLQFSQQVNMAISSPEAVILNSESPICIEITKDNKSNNLFTSLQNERDEYFSMKDWEARNILRVVGTEVVLKELCSFLKDLSAGDEGYSYLSEFSASSEYSRFSPEWRLHVHNT
jgi:type I restriction-modification system DNA methylase subunit